MDNLWTIYGYGWWYIYPSETYESQLGWWHSQFNIWKQHVPNHQPGVNNETYYRISFNNKYKFRITNGTCLSHLNKIPWRSINLWMCFSFFRMPKKTSSELCMFSPTPLVKYVATSRVPYFPVMPTFLVRLAMATPYEKRLVLEPELWRGGDVQWHPGENLTNGYIVAVE